MQSTAIAGSHNLPMKRGIANRNPRRMTPVCSTTTLIASVMATPSLFIGSRDGVLNEIDAQ